VCDAQLISTKAKEDDLMPPAPMAMKPKAVYKCTSCNVLLELQL